MSDSFDEKDEKEHRFFELWVKHQPSIYAYIVTLLNDPHGAEDVLQESAAVLWRKKEAYDGKCSFTTWACGVARLEAFRYLRDHRKRTLHLSETLLSDIASRLEAMLTEKPTLVEDRRAALQQCLSQLSVSQRQILSMRYTDDLSVRSMATHLGTSATALHGKLRRLRDRLGACIRHRLKQMTT